MLRAVGALCISFIVFGSTLPVTNASGGPAEAQAPTPPVSMTITTSASVTELAIVASGTSDIYAPYSFRIDFVVPQSCPTC